MRVKVSKLKTHLSSYLKNLDQAGEIEICLREDPVAYLVPVGAKNKSSAKVLHEKVSSVGLTLYQSPAAGARNGLLDYFPEPRIAGDGRADISTMEWIREERGY